VERVRTFFNFWWQQPDFVDVLDCAELPRKRRGEDLLGVIELTAGGVVVLGRDHFVADIELLWSSMSDLVARCRADGRATVPLPDQPGDILLEPVGRDLLRATLAIGDLRWTSVAGKEELLSAIATGGVEFFEKMADLTGRNFSAETKRLTGA
jgi:hypothetical protein